MEMTVQELASMIDLSAVRADSSADEVRTAAQMARRYRCICVTALPTYTPLLVELLADEPDIRVSGNVAFPAGGASPTMKVAETRDLLAMGCDELDMVMNIGRLRAGDEGYVLDDIRGVVEAAGNVPVKVILECHYLTDEEIRRACALCVQAGAAFIKTSTGWAPTGATLENVSLIRSCVGDAIAIKAAGGIRDLATVEAMVHRGASRFGVGVRSAQGLFDQCAARSRSRKGG